MCLIVWAWQVHPDYPLILIAHRDEFHLRPSAASAFWPESAQLLAGRDLQAGGTWLGVTRARRMAALTNYRDPRQLGRPARSRGALPLHFLQSSLDPAAWLEQQRASLSEYNDFNLLVADPAHSYCLESRHREIQPITPGIHGLSNERLDTPWPKVEAGKQRLQSFVEQLAPHESAEEFPALLARLGFLLKDSHPYPDETLPHTGVTLERERALSASFIIDPHYGTRSITAVVWKRCGATGWLETRFNQAGQPAGSSRFIW